MKKSLFALILCLTVLMAACAALGTAGSASSGGVSEPPPVAEPQPPMVEPAPPAEEPAGGTDTSVQPDGSADADTPPDGAVSEPTPDAGDSSSDADSSAQPPADSSAQPSGPDGEADTPDGEPPAEEPPAEEPDKEDPPEEPEDAGIPVPEPIAPNGIPAVCITTAADTDITRSKYVDCAVAVVDPSGVYETVSDMECTIKVRGHSSSQGEKKPYNFKFSSKQELLGLGKGKKWALLSNMYDKTQLRNLLSFGFANDIGMPYIQQSTFVEVYLNGEYQGLYQLCEPVDVDETKVDIDEEGSEALLEIEPRGGYSNDHWMKSPRFGLILGFNAPEDPTDDQRAYYKGFLGLAEDAMASGDYAEVCKYVDVESFANAYIVQELFKQVDYATSSTRFYIKEGKLHEGPVWDFDLSSGNCSSKLYPEYNNKSTTGLSWQGIHCVALWNKYLFKYDEFRQLVSDRLLQLQPVIVNLYEDNELGRSRMDAWLDEYRDDIDRNNEIWSTKVKYNAYEHTPVDGTYDGEIDFLRDWLKNRNGWLLDYYCGT